MAISKSTMKRRAHAQGYWEAFVARREQLKRHVSTDRAWELAYAEVIDPETHYIPKNRDAMGGDYACAHHAIAYWKMVAFAIALERITTAFERSPFSSAMATLAKEQLKAGRELRQLVEMASRIYGSDCWERARIVMKPAKETH